MGKPLCVQELCLSRLDAGILFTALLVMMLLFFFFRYTDLGLAMRATAQNPLASRLVGIPVGRMLAVGWALSTVVGALAGILTAQSLGLDINLMSSVLLFAFTAAVLGGLDSPFGAVVSGLLIGVLKNLAGAYAPQLLGNVDLTIAFAVIVLVLLLRPTGLFGQQAYHRV